MEINKKILFLAVVHVRPLNECGRGDPEHGWQQRDIFYFFFKVSIGCWFIALTGDMASKIVN